MSIKYVVFFFTSPPKYTSHCSVPLRKSEEDNVLTREKDRNDRGKRDSEQTILKNERSSTIVIDLIRFRMKVAGIIAFCRIYSTDLRRNARQSSGEFGQLAAWTSISDLSSDKSDRIFCPCVVSHSNEHDRMLHSAVSFILQRAKGNFCPR